MHIALRINMDGQYLEVTSVCYDPNPITVLYPSRLSQYRRVLM